MTATEERPPLIADEPVAENVAPPERGDLLSSLPGALLAAFAGWVVLLAWRPLAEDPGRITTPLFVGALLIAVVGWGVRRWSGRVWVAFVAQVLVLLVWSLHRVLDVWLPTPGNVGRLADVVGQGIVASQRYYSPVPVQYAEFHVMVGLGGLAIILAIDLIACGWRQPAVAGLPMLLSITIAASILIEPISIWVFAAATLSWMALVVLREAHRLGAWRPSRIAPTAGVIGIVSVLVAALLTSGLGTEGRLFQNTGPGDGDGPGESLDIDNPLLDMRRNLRQTRDIPVVNVETPNASPSDPTPSYVRLSVLDSFNGAAWYPTARDDRDTRPVSGDMPYPTGLSPTAAGDSRAWVFDIAPVFRTRWLPLPTPTTNVSVGDDWRYDPTTLDVSSTSRDAGGMRYRADTFDIAVDPAQMQRAEPAPDSIRSVSTALPRLPDVFRQTANEVTAAATNDWDRAVLLQQWFRSDGGFEYSTEPAAGNGIRTLERFITTDKVGYCEQFATAMATMARSLGIPARVAVGFLRPTETGDNRYTFSTQDLHAWPELYFSGVGWVKFEPTPGSRTGDAPDYTDNQIAPQEAPSTEPTPTEQPTSPTDVPSESPDDASASANSGPHWSVWVLGALVVVLAGLAAAAPLLLRRSRVRRRWARASDPRAMADAAWEEVRETSLDLGLGWSETASVRVNGAHLREAVDGVEARDAIGEIVRTVELTRYAGAHGAGPVTRDRLRADVERWRSAAYAEADPRTARRARWWPGRG